ncbi:hypothetical protein HQ560_02210, partial [bacterium]|nr:hypothetical protein [bacterium]
MSRCALVVLALASIATAGERPVLAILDFAVPGGGALGRKVAERLEKRAIEANTHVLFDRDDLQMAVAEAKLDIRHTGNEQAIQDFARDALGAHLVLWGKVVPLDDTGFHIYARCMKTSGKPVPYLDVDKKVANFAGVANFYTDFEPILLEKRTALRTLKPVDAAARGRNLIQNPSFEKGADTPVGWSPVDGLCTFWIDRGDGKGKCIKCDTNVLESQAVPWMQKVRSGKAKAKDAPKPIPVKPSQIYATIGGLTGVQVYSHYIPVKTNMRYRLSVDIKAKWGGIFFPKAFVKGYGDNTDEFTTQKREFYRAYLALRTKTQGKEWETFTRTFNPSLRNAEVKYMRVMLYAYWPLGDYYWDNIILTEEA